MRKLLSLLAVFVVSLLTFSMVSALNDTNLGWGTIKINGDVVNDGDILSVEEGQALDIRVGLVAQTGASDIEVEAEIGGYEYSDYESLSDSTHVFDLAPDTTKYVNLKVALPDKLDKDQYWLRLRILDKNTAALEKELTLAVEPARHGVDIADVSFSPSTTLKAGKALIATVLLENYGDKDEENVKVTVAMPELGLSTSEYVDALETDNHNVDYQDVPEMFLPIPANAAEGEYNVVVSAKYDEYEAATKTYKVKVLANELFAQVPEKLVLAIGPETQKVAVGQTATYAVALTNAGTASKAYLLESAAGDWATASLSDTLVVLEPGKNKVVYVNVKPTEVATAGEHVASLVVKSGDEVLETIALKATVEAAPANATNFNLRSGLEVALIILVVLLVIIGLVVGFSRLKKSDEEEEKTYY